MNLNRDVKPITDLKNATAKLVGQVSKEGRTIVITQNGEAKAVLMGVETFDRWRQALSLLKIIEQSEADFEAGALLSPEEVFTRSDERIQAARER